MKGCGKMLLRNVTYMGASLPILYQFRTKIVFRMKIYASSNSAHSQNKSGIIYNEHNNKEVQSKMDMW